MTAAVLAAAWAAFVAVAVRTRWRPLPSRVRARVRQGRGVRRPAPVATARPGGPSPGPAAVARTGWCGERRPRPPWHLVVAGVLGAATLGVAPALAPLAAAGAWAAPRVQARREEGRRQRALEANLPEVVDLVSLAVGAGCNVRLAVAAAGRRGTGELAAELRRVASEVASGRRCADALDDVPRRVGEAVRPLTAVLVACERYGTPLVPALERLADELRRRRQRRAEEAARKVPVKLLFPLVVCILPAFALLTVAPLVAGSLRELRL